MDFSKVDISKILKSSVKSRFEDFTPQDFEDFIAQLYKDMGYEVEQTSYSGDYGADIIVKKDSVKTAVQIKRYAKTNKVGVQDINQVLGARDYYKCSNCSVVTTSSFSKSGVNLAKETQTELIDWDELLKMIRETYWKGVDYFTFYGEQESAKIDNHLTFTVKRLEKDIELKSNDSCNIVYVEIENLTNSTIELELGLPSYITGDFKQIDGDNLLSTSFTGGNIYSGCTVEAGYIFISTDNIQLKEGDKVVSNYIQKSPKVKPKGKTVISTYGANSEESGNIDPNNLKTLRTSSEIEKYVNAINEYRNVIKDTTQKLDSVNSQLQLSKLRNSKLNRYLLISLIINAILITLLILSLL